MNSSTKTYKCEICLKAFPRLCDLKRHELVHTDERQRPFECEFCHKEFSTSYYLHRHSVIHTGEMPFECDICFKKFKNSSDLKRHTVIHTGETPFECEICGREFNDKSNLRAHGSTHLNRKSIQCSICGIFTGRKTTLRRHIQRQHNLDGDHLEYEVRRSTRNVSRDGHGTTSQTAVMGSNQSAQRYEYESSERWNGRVDTSNRMRERIDNKWTYQFSEVPRHNCNSKRLPTIHTRKSVTCHKQFVRPFERKRHHFAERPFECGTCGQTFKQKPHLRSHELTHQDNMFRCSICGIFVKHKAGIRQHLRKQHYFMGEQLNDAVKNIYESSRTRENGTHEMTDVDGSIPILDERFLGTNLEYLEVGQEWKPSDQFVDVSNTMVANTEMIEQGSQRNDDSLNFNDPEEVLNKGNIELDQFEWSVPHFEKMDYSKYPELDPEVWYSGIIREQLETSRMAL
ncbi:hypothetical protein GCK72_007690 [Caenorhabditis remanei]|uniref:C2H2-type domain-containing protein n=1 Tax=Caenorhabditis remanei TaxID=31234 RepID=A0A6A5HKS2_CAERE|nr:hypothetical protein GCK72_007690 [Caenorhabditis remanei]KAF1767731.1 hypothetical protein GCK72_007690 [Caenorhabditis remanei]